MNAVKLIFKNKEYNYTTSVSNKVGLEEAKEYFLGTIFNLGSYPIENLQECIDIKFIKRK